MSNGNKWNWINGFFAGIVFLDLIFLSLYLLSIPDNHFDDIHKRVGIIGGWLVAIAAYLGITKGKIRGTLDQVFSSKPIRICIIILTVFSVLLTVPIHSVEIHSTSNGAYIYIDNEKGSRGTTPQKIKGLYFRMYNIRLEKKGFEDYTRTVSFIEVLKHKRINIDLEPKIGTLRIESVPEGADLYINNEKESKGTTPETLNLPVNTYRLTLKKEHWDIKTIDIKVEQNPNKPRKVKLTYDDQHKYSLTVMSVPREAEIWIYEDFKGNTNRDVELPKGEHVIRLKKNGKTGEGKVKIPDQNMVIIQMKQD